MSIGEVVLSLFTINTAKLILDLNTYQSISTAEKNRDEFQHF